MIRITAIKKDETISADNPHLRVVSFKWIDDQTQRAGVTPREGMYDFLVNKKGQAFFRDPKDTTGAAIYLFGAVSPSGSTYLRGIKDGKWVDTLLDLPTFV